MGFHRMAGGQDTQDSQDSQDAAARAKHTGTSETPRPTERQRTPQTYAQAGGRWIVRPLGNVTISGNWHFDGRSRGICA